VEERKFFYNLCSKTLEIDKSIQFTSVVNSEGKLIVGKSRQCVVKKYVNREYNFFGSQPKQVSDAISYENNSIYSILSKRDVVLYSNSVLKSDFQLIGLYNNMHIAFVTLNENQDKYLCIYFESCNPIQDVLLKLNTIFEYID
jgi:hypothetical protein